MATRGSQKGAETRKLILDAAEILFSRHGYNGASLRDIATAADVRMGLVHYHFGNKQDIFGAVVERNLGDLFTVISHSFAAADQNAGPDGLDIQATVSAFILPFLVIASTPDHSLRHYVIMTSHLMSSYRLPELRPILGKLSIITDVFERRIRALMPDCDEADVLAGIYLIEAALIFMVQDPGFLDDLSREHHSSTSLDQMAGPAIRFFSAGLERLLHKPD